MPPETPSPPTDRDAVLNVVAEDLHVGRERQPTAKVRVSVEPETVPLEIPLEWWTEHTEIERRPVDATAAERREPWLEGDTLVVPVYEERLVVQRVLTLVEEVRLRKVRQRHAETRAFPVRMERVHVERVGAAAAPEGDATAGAHPAAPSTPPTPEGDSR